MSEKITDYDYELPESLIAQNPAARRSDARLLLVRRNPLPGELRFEDLLIRDLPRLLASEEKLKNALLFRNRSKVFPARFYAHRPSGSRHEIVLIEALNPEKTLWKAIIRNSRRFHYPETLRVESEGNYSVLVPEENKVDLSLLGEKPLESLDRFGEMPLPPYIYERESLRDRERYQSVWALPNEAASAAAPTASLHFDDGLLAEIENVADFVDLILHVGLGTFEPLREIELDKNNLHSEQLSIPRSSAALMESSDRTRIAIGTTALRCMESFALREKSPLVKFAVDSRGDWSGETRIFIRPGFEFRVADALLTNFHLPKSSLLVLVASFAGSKTLALEAYQHAVKKNYRFFSYGDASLWI